MNKRDTGTLKRITQLAPGYLILHFEPQKPIPISPGTTITLGGKRFGVMRHHVRRNIVELLGESIAPQWQEDMQLEYQLNEESFTFKAPGKNDTTHYLLVSEEQGIGPGVFLAEQLKRYPNTQTTVLAGFSDALPFRATPSQIIMPSLPPHVIASIPLLEEWGIASRIAHTAGAPGCYEEGLLQLTHHWLENTLNQLHGRSIELFVCASGSTNLEIKKMAEEHTLPCHFLEI